MNKTKLGASLRQMETRAAHVGHSPDHQFADVAMPLHPSVNFEYRDLATTKSDYGYARHRHPTREQYETALTQIEGASHALAFSSGVAAIDAVLRSLRPSDHVVADADLFGGTYALLERVYRPSGIEVTYADMSGDLAEVEAAIRPRTRIFLLETPTNPFLRIVNIASIAQLARAASASLVVDNTFATPVLQRPLEHGAHFVVYSATKHFSGHSDIVGGAVMMNDAEAYDRIKDIQYMAGAVPSTFDCWLLVRSLKTLAVRVQRQCENAARVASLLAADSSIEAVFYPGLPAHPGHETARRQMSHFGSMMSFIPKGGVARAREIYDRVRVFTRASSLGAVESLIVAPIAGPHISRAGTAGAPPAHLLRLSIGIEHVDDLLDDLRAALATKV
jgi:cystathionine gamma-synthase